MATWKCTKGKLSEIYSDLRNHLHPIEFEIVIALEEVAVQIDLAENPKAGAARTENILTTIKNLGSRLGYDARTEWLFDLVWINRRKEPWLPVPNFIPNTKWGDFGGLRLACESELRGEADEVLADFSKLTVTNADLRLFIHSNQYYWFPERDHVPVAELCASIIENPQNDRYLLVGFDWGAERKPEFRVDLLFR